LEPAVYLVILVDADPPGQRFRDRGYFPPDASAGPPDFKVVSHRLENALDVIKQSLDGRAVFTVHTSPLYRNNMFREPYLSFWRKVVEAGGELALHAHEDRLNGKTYFDDQRHLESMVTTGSSLAADAGLALTSFRSGFFAFNDGLTSLLERAGLVVDLSCAPGVDVPERDAFWPREWKNAGYLCPQRFTDTECSHSMSSVLEIPLGWDGKGSDLGDHYLFNERSGLDRLKSVWCAMLERSRTEGPLMANFLCHGSGLIEEKWKVQAVEFFRFVQENEGVILLPSQAHEVFRSNIRPAIGRRLAGESSLLSS